MYRVIPCYSHCAVRPPSAPGLGLGKVLPSLEDALGVVVHVHKLAMRLGSQLCGLGHTGHRVVKGRVQRLAVFNAVLLDLAGGKGSGDNALRKYLLGVTPSNLSSATLLGGVRTGVDVAAVVLQGVVPAKVSVADRADEVAPVHSVNGGTMAAQGSGRDHQVALGALSIPRTRVRGPSCSRGRGSRIRIAA